MFGSSVVQAWDRLRDSIEIDGLNCARGRWALGAWGFDWSSVLDRVMADSLIVKQKHKTIL